MCLGIPGEVQEIEAPGELEPFSHGVVSFGGVRKRICLAYVPDAQVGDYVIVHAGFALSVVDSQEAERIFEALAEIDAIEKGSVGVDQEAKADEISR